MQVKHCHRAFSVYELILSTVGTLSLFTKGLDRLSVETTDAKKGPSSAKPKRYSSQRQRSNATDEQQFHNQEADSTSIQDGQFYNQLPQQGLPLLRFVFNLVPSSLRVCRNREPCHYVHFYDISR